MAIFRFGVNDYSVVVRAKQQVRLYQGWDVHRLTLTFDVTALDDYPADAPFLVSGSLWTSDTSGPARWIGVLHPSSGPISLKPFTTELILQTSVTDGVLRGLEERRAGATLQLRAHLTLTGLAESQRWPVASDNEAVDIPHTVWSEQLMQLDMR
ncbi:hypothetical protein [Streptomyces chartreusis]